MTKYNSDEINALAEELKGSATCAVCEEEFTTANPCVDSYASYDDGTHDDGICRDCKGN